MDWLRQIADWLRSLVLEQVWLAPAHQAIERAPDWIFLTAPALIASLAALVWWSFWRATRSRSRLSPSVVVAAADPPWVKQTVLPPSQRAPIAKTENESGSVRVFVSSTFRDMQRERDVLVKRTFPALRARLRPRGVELFEVDLRWGVSRDDVESARALARCLISIDDCRPYFIGILGDRYGSVLNLSAELKAAYPSLARLQSASATEFEIVHGVLSDKNTAGRALFFERRGGPPSGEDAKARARQADLKARVRASGARVETYRTPEELAAKVEAALGEMLEARFPENEEADAFIKESRLHEAYARERRTLYVGAECMTALDAWIEQPDAPILITGASGAGKSALVANWVSTRRKSQPNEIIVEHYLAASPESADAARLMRRLCEHLDRASGDASEAPDGRATLADLAEHLARRLTQAQAYAERTNTTVLIVLDGLEKLGPEQGLRWLPRELGPRVRLLASSLEGEARRAGLARGWKELEVSALSHDQRRALVSGTLRRWQKGELEPERLERILAHPLAGSPLFLKVVLDEMRYSAIEERFDQRLDFYLGAQSIADLFARMLDRLDADNEPDATRRLMSAIWASRAGLEEAELVLLARTTPAVWISLRNGLGGALREEGGRMAFSHDFLRTAVEARYLATSAEREGLHALLADHFENREPDLRQAEELPFQLVAAGAWARLEATLTDLMRLPLLIQRGEVELLSHWLALIERGRSPETLLCAAFDKLALDAERAPKAYVRVGALLQQFLQFAGAAGQDFERLSEQIAIIAERFDDGANAITAAANLAAVRAKRGDLDGAKALIEPTLEKSTRLFGRDDPTTLEAMNLLAWIHMTRREFAEARPLLEELLDAKTRLRGARHPDALRAKHSLGVLLFEAGELDRALCLALSVSDERAIVLGPEHPSTLSSRLLLGSVRAGQGDLDEARNLLEGLLPAMTRVLGAEHPETLSTLSALAITLNKSGEQARGRAMLEELIATRIRVLGSEHPDTLAAMSNLARTLVLCGDIKRAHEIFLHLADVQARVLGPHHPFTRASWEEARASEPHPH